MKRQILALATLLALGLAQVMAQDNSAAASVAPAEQAVSASASDSIVNAADSAFAETMDAEVTEMTVDDWDTDYAEENRENDDRAWFESYDDGPGWQIVIIVFIIMVVPCVAVVLILLVLFRFLHKRNRERNELIAMAIDKDYELPESFYTKQPTYTPPTIVQAAPGENAENNGNAVSAQGATPQPKEQYIWQNQPVVSRNPRTLSTGLTLLAVGLAVFLSCAAYNNVGLGFIIGGIPLFIGIAKLVGYFFVPGYGSSPSGQMPPRNPNQENYGRQQRYDRNYDPRYNPHYNQRYEQGYDPRFAPRQNQNSGNQGANPGYGDNSVNYGQPDGCPENPPRNNPGDGCPPVPPEYRE